MCNRKLDFISAWTLVQTLHLYFHFVAGIFVYQCSGLSKVLEKMYWPCHWITKIFMGFPFLFSNGKDIFSCIHKNNFYPETLIIFLRYLKTFHFEVNIFLPSALEVHFLFFRGEKYLIYWLVLFLISLLYPAASLHPIFDVLLSSLNIYILLSQKTYYIPH